jgi:hypothetical protein
LPGNDRKDKHADTLIDGKDLRKFTVEMGSVAMIYIVSCKKIDSSIQQLIEARHRQIA